MTTLANAPLLEVITEIRWGTTYSEPDGGIRFEFGRDEEKAPPPQLQSLLSSVGYDVFEQPAPAYEDVHFARSRRYRSSSKAWPVVYSGVGVATIHQGNDGYEWETYKAAVLDAYPVIVEAVSELYPDGVVPFIGIELTYVDAFVLAEGQSPRAFLRKAIRVPFGGTDELTKAPFVQGELVPLGAKFAAHISKPIGALFVALEYEDQLMGRAGFLMETRVRSLGESIEYTPLGIGDWLEAAHEVQRHAFKTLIKPAFLRSFQ